jgi:hypothetical protein
LSGNDRPLQFKLGDEKFEVVGDGGHIEAVIGFGTLAMTALVDGNHVVAKIYQVLGNADLICAAGGGIFGHKHLVARFGQLDLQHDTVRRNVVYDKDPARHGCLLYLY